MKERLMAAALMAMQHAYAPYSSFCVGAALLCEDGSIYTGCNVENASYGATICAERTALVKAVSEGKRRFCALAICGGKDGVLNDKPCVPCGVCRQMLSEFCDADFEVYLITNRAAQTVRLGELLPMGFTGDILAKTH